MTLQIGLIVNKIFDIIYFDFSKAFDSITHGRLFISLKAYGTTGNVLKCWLKSYFIDCKKRVVKTEMFVISYV